MFVVWDDECAVVRHCMVTLNVDGNIGGSRPITIFWICRSLKSNWWALGVGGHKANKPRCWPIAHASSWMPAQKYTGSKSRTITRSYLMKNKVLCMPQPELPIYIYAHRSWPVASCGYTATWIDRKPKLLHNIQSSYNLISRASVCHPTRGSISLWMFPLWPFLSDCCNSVRQLCRIITAAVSFPTFILKCSLT